MAQSPDPTPPSTEVRRARRLARNNRMPMRAALIGVVLLVLFTWMTRRTRPPAPPTTPRVSVQPFAVHGDSELTVLAGPVLESLHHRLTTLAPVPTDSVNTADYAATGTLTRLSNPIGPPLVRVELRLIDARLGEPAKTWTADPVPDSAAGKVVVRLADSLVAFLAREDPPGG